MKLKSKTYYKVYDNNGDGYDIVYTGTKWIYRIAEKYRITVLHTFNKKRKWGTIREWQSIIEYNGFKIKELSKEELFLELL